MRLFVAALLVGAVIGAVAPAAADDDDSDVAERRCPLGKGQRPGRIVTTTDKETCGSGGCSQQQSIEVVDGNSKVLLAWSSDVGGDLGGGVDLSVACKGGAVVIADPKGELLKLSYDASEQQLKLAPAVRKQVEAGWRAPPAHDDAAARERLAEAFDALTPHSAGPYDKPPFEILGLDPELVQSLWLLVARDKIEAGAWESGEKIVDHSVPATPPPLVAGRRKAVTARLAALRRASAPMAVAERHRIGTMPGEPALPLDAGVAPTLFWRGESLCVVQEDRKPPTEMRCLEPTARKWGAREPLQKPKSSGERLRSLTYPNVTRCDGAYVVQKNVPDGESACTGGPGESAEMLVGVVDGDAMLLAGERGIWVNRGPKKDEKLTPQKAATLLASSGGTWLVGDGCCRLLAGGRIERVGQNSEEHRWPILGAAPRDQRWSATPLASPSQTWAVAFSTAATGNAPGVTLWLVRLARRP